MKTIHIHHDGQYWRGFKQGMLALAIGIIALVVALAQGQSARSQSLPATVNQIDPASVGPLRPLPEWFKTYDTVTLHPETVYDLDRHGMRPVPAAKAASCQ